MYNCVGYIYPNFQDDKHNISGTPNRQIDMSHVTIANMHPIPPRLEAHVHAQRRGFRHDTAILPIPTQRN